MDHAWHAGRFTLDLSVPRVMGIVNLTPDSFSDGGLHATPQSALAHAQRLVEEGADLLDVGAESTRPGAAPVSPDEEWARLAPLLPELVRWGVPVSVDTRRPEVMARALDAGVDIINDVQALSAPGALALLAAHGRAGVCLMHMRGEPATMQQQVHYAADVVDTVRLELGLRLQAAQEAGIAMSRITLDPGIGFSKSPAHNLALLGRQAELLALGRPLLIGWSRKSTLGQLTGRPVDQRLGASVAAALLAAQRGAGVLRVHDVAATVHAVRVARATLAAR